MVICLLQSSSITEPWSYLILTRKKGDVITIEFIIVKKVE
jgi:hypothetical protein